MSNENKFDAAAIIEAMEQYHDVKPVELKASSGEPVGSVLAVPSGLQLKSLKPFLDEYLPRPERRRGLAKLLALDSLIAHANRFKTRHSAAFVNDGDPPYLSVVYDYHQGNERDDEGAILLGEPDWCVHRAHYAFPLSDEWKAWRGATEAMTQAEFAAFIEDRIADVVDPSNATTRVTDYAQTLGLTLASPSQLMAISRSLAIRIESKAAQAVNLSTGETQIVYEEEHKDAGYGPLKVPGAVAIAIPVFRNGAPYSIGVRLRYRLDPNQRKILWWVSLHNTERILAHAVNEACTKFCDDTAIPLYYGAPEQG